MTYVDIKYISKYSSQLFYLRAICEMDLQQDYFSHSFSHLLFTEDSLLINEFFAFSSAISQLSANHLQ